MKKKSFFPKIKWTRLKVFFYSFWWEFLKVRWKDRNYLVKMFLGLILVLAVLGLFFFFYEMAIIELFKKIKILQ